MASDRLRRMPTNTIAPTSTAMNRVSPLGIDLKTSCAINSTIRLTQTMVQMKAGLLRFFNAVLISAAKTWAIHQSVRPADRKILA